MAKARIKRYIYCSEVWGFCKADKIERVHLQFCKSLLGVKQSTQNTFIYGELGENALSDISLFSYHKILVKGN